MYSLLINHFVILQCLFPFSNFPCFGVHIFRSIPAFCLLIFSWYIGLSFFFLTFNQLVPLHLMWVSWEQYIVGWGFFFFLFLVHSACCVCSAAK
jgi:hypothetical protein